MQTRYGSNIATFRARALVAAGLLLLAGQTHAVLIDFDDVAAGTPIDTIGNVQFSFNNGLQLIASDTFDTSSGANALGVDDGGSQAFLEFFGDVVTLSFDTPIVSLSVAFVSTPGTPDGTYSITTALGRAVSTSPPDTVLGDGGEVFRLTFSSATPFGSAELSGDSGLDIHSFNIDDIEFVLAQPVPAPPTIGALGLALLGARLRRRVGPHSA